MKAAFAILIGLVWCTGSAAEKTAQPVTEIGKLAASMNPGDINELVTKNCNRDLFKMWYDWEEDDIKKYGSQKMFDVICWNNDVKWDPVTRQVLVINGGHYSSFKCKWMCDPVSGEYIGTGVRDERVFAFHPVRDQWKEIPGLRLPEGESLGVSIDTYGVMMLLVRTKGREFRCYVYKHKPVFP